MLTGKSKKYLILFFVVTLLWTWICGFLPVILGIRGTPLGSFLFYFGGGAPSVTALFLVFLTYEKDRRKNYFRRCFRISGNILKWMGYTALFFAGAAALGLIFAVRLRGLPMPGMDFLKAIAANPVNLFLVLFLSVISGPLNEEFGWRGYALDPLLLRFGFVKANLLLGFIWAVWHLAWYLTPGQAQYNMLQKSLFDALAFLPSSISLCFVVTFVYIKTGRSILAGAMVHMLSNLMGSQLLSPYDTEVGTVIRLVNIFFCTTVAIYAVRSSEFQRELTAAAARIEEEINDRGISKQNADDPVK